MAKKITNAALAKKLGTELAKKADALQMSCNKIQQFINIPAGLLGGFKMLQKLKRQARLQQELVNVLREREQMFEDYYENVVETK
jgi:hypothetical protein